MDSLLFNNLFNSPLGRTTSVVVPTGLTQTYNFEKKTKTIIKFNFYWGKNISRIRI